MSFLKAYIEGYKRMAFASSDLDRLKFAPQRVEEGEIFDFNNRSMFGAIDSEIVDQVILDADRLNKATRFTTALKNEYETGLDKFINSLRDSEDLDLDFIYDTLYEIIGSGDRDKLKDLKKDLKAKWFALDNEEVEDVLMSLMEACIDKDVSTAMGLISNLGKGSEEEPIAMDEPIIGGSESASKEDVTMGDIRDIVEVLESAIKDDDKEDIKELLAELKEKDLDTYNRYKDIDTKEEEKKDDSLIDEIKEDLDDALKNDDKDEFKELLAELKEEVGEDADLYKEYKAKLPQRKRRR